MRDGDVGGASRGASLQPLSFFCVSAPDSVICRPFPPPHLRARCAYAQPSGALTPCHHTTARESLNYFVRHHKLMLLFTLWSVFCQPQLS